MKEYLFTTELETRDYECDLQGVVNNANYQHYLEYTRHKWLQSRGQSFQQWHEKGIVDYALKVAFVVSGLKFCGKLIFFHNDAKIMLFQILLSTFVNY